VARKQLAQIWYEEHGCIVLTAHYTVFGSKRPAIFATAELSSNVFFKLNDLHISTTVPATGAHRQKKSSGIVADTVANVIAALLTYNARAVHDPVSRYFIE